MKRKLLLLLIIGNFLVFLLFLPSVRGGICLEAICRKCASSYCCGVEVCDPYCECNGAKYCAYCKPESGNGNGGNGGNGGRPRPPPPPPPCTKENRCRSNDVWRWCDGWQRKVQECGSSTGWSGWSGWSCANPNTKQRTKTRTLRGCSGRSCYSNTDTQRHPVNCPYGCIAGKCQPKADWTETIIEKQEAGTLMQLDASPSRDPYGREANLAYDWAFGDGTTGTGKTVQHLIPKGASYEITLTVTTQGLTGEIEAPDNGTTHSKLKNHNAPTIVINAEPEPFVATEAMLNAEGTTDDDDPVSELFFEWDYENDGVIDATFDKTNASDPNRPDLEPGTHTFTVPGINTIALTVTDTIGLFNTKTATVDVQNNPPIAAFQMIPTPASGMVPLNVRFIDKSTDPDGHSIVSWQWDFGLGEGTSTDKDTEHKYEDEGTWTVTLIVTDEYLTDSLPVTKTINPKQKAAITIFSATNPENKTEPADIIIACSKPVTARIEYLDRDGVAVAGMTATTLDPCPDSPIALQSPLFPEKGIYLLKATITSEECENCPVTKYIIVGMEELELEAPELPAIFAVGIALAVLLVIGRRRQAA